MLSTLVHLDRTVFYFINHTLGNPFFDLIMPWLREKLVWIPLYIFLISFCLIKYKLKGLYLILLLMIAVGLSDLISAHLIKILVQRPRPCNNFSLARLIIKRVACGNGFSFVSSHASNHFAIAGFLIAVFGTRYRWVIPAAFAWAFLICFAQVYVGVHYPVDVTAGAILGWCIGTLMAKAGKYWNLNPVID